MKFVSTQQVKRVGKNTRYVTIDGAWGIEPGDMVNITVEVVGRGSSDQERH